MMFSCGLTKFKSLEIGFNRIDKEANSANIEYRARGDHRGFYSSIYIYGFGFEFNIYDIRHENCGGFLCPSDWEQSIENAIEEEKANR